MGRAGCDVTYPTWHGGVQTLSMAGPSCNRCKSSGTLVSQQALPSPPPHLCTSAHARWQKSRSKLSLYFRPIIFAHTDTEREEIRQKVNVSSLKFLQVSRSKYVYPQFLGNYIIHRLGRRGAEEWVREWGEDSEQWSSTKEGRWGERRRVH